MARALPTLLVACLALALGPGARADDARTPARVRTPVPHGNGPRRVPEARGASARRAAALGLGTREAANRLMHGRPDPRWVEAAGGSMPPVLHWPVALGRFGRGFGFVRRTRPDLRHDGVDIVAAEGSTLRAVAPGIVGYSDNGVRGFGNAVMIVHPNGWVSVYAHCYRTTVPAGYRVRAGERIGFVGTTGISRGPHVHF
ncbi:MAG: M23 family metallopeptidase, partial [Myxococcota bacterium]